MKTERRTDGSPLLWILVATLVIVACGFVPNALDSGIARIPLFALGATLIVALSIAGWISAGKVDVPWTSLHLVIALHLLLFVLSGFLTYNALYTPAALAFGLSCVAMFIVGSLAFRDFRAVRRIADAVEWLSVLLCVIGLLQLIAGDRLPLEFYLGARQRVPSLLGNSLFFSSYLVLALPVSVARILHSSGHTSPFRYLLIVMMGTCLIATQTRSSEVGIIAGFLVMTWWAARRKEARRAAATLLMFGILALLVLISSGHVRRLVQETFDRQGRNTVERRFVIWEAGEKALAASPWVGHGIGLCEPSVFAYRSAEYWKSGSEDIVPHAHNEVLEIGIEYGLSGLLASATLVTLLCARGLKLARHSTGERRWFAIGIGAGIAGLAVDNMANVSLRQPSIAMLAWLFMGLLASSALDPEIRRRSLAVPTPPLAGRIVVMSAWIIFVVWYGAPWIDRIRGDMLVLKGLQEQNASAAASVRDLQEAVALSPGHLLGRMHLARELLVMGDWQNALAETDTLLTLSPRYPRVSLIRAFALHRLGRQSDALESADAELRVRSHPEAEEIRRIILSGR